jgi:hypothetical protein
MKAVRGRYISNRLLLRVGSALLFVFCCAAPSWSMVMHVEGNQLIVTGPLSGFEVNQFGVALTSNVTTVVFYNSSGEEFASHGRWHDGAPTFRLSDDASAHWVCPYHFSSL